MAHIRRSPYTLLGSSLLLVTLSVAISSSTYAKPATAPAGDPYDAARDAEGRLDYKGVVANATKALDMANTHDRLVDIYRLLGTANGVLGKSADAVEAFTRLLAVDPEHKLPRGTSPKITTPFKEAGGFWVDRPGGLSIVPTLPREMQAGKALSIPIKVDDALGMTINVRLSYRVQGEGDFKKVEVPNGPSMSVTIPPDDLPVKSGDYVLEVYAAALGQTGSELRLAGDAAHPLTIAIRTPGGGGTVVTSTGALVVNEPAKPRKPLIKTWWFWTAIGAVVVVGAGLGGGLGYAFGRPDTSHVDANLSSTVKMLRF